jgi:hypothetical protein
MDQYPVAPPLLSTYYRRKAAEAHRAVEEVKTRAIKARLHDLAIWIGWPVPLTGLRASRHARRLIGGDGPRQSTAARQMSSVRRLTAILAADVAGYSRLMGVDEEGTHERLKAHLGQLVDPKIKEHRGRTVKNTGDGLFAEFASVVDAVRCAAEVQRAMSDRNAETVKDKRITVALLHGSVAWRRGVDGIGGRAPADPGQLPCHSKRTKIAVITFRSSVTE